MRVSVVIASYGDQAWSDLAWGRAYPSAVDAEADDIVVVHQERGSLEDARNQGAEEATGDWLCFLDADDELDIEYVDRMRVAIGDGVEQRLLAPAVTWVRPSGQTAPAIPNTHMTMPPLNHCVIGTLVHRDVFAHVNGFREGYRPWEDYELWLRCIRLAGCYVQYVDDATYVAHVNDESDHRTITPQQATRLASRIHREHRRGAR